MTCFIQKDGVLYADSLMEKGGEIFTSLNKVNRFDRPIRLKSNSVDANTRQGVVKSKIDDWIHGYVVTGSIPHGKTMVDWLMFKQDCSLHYLLLALKLSVSLDLFVGENYSEVVLIGEKASYSIDPLREGAMTSIYSHDEIWSVGAGRDEMRELYKHHGHDTCPIRALYVAESKHPNALRGPYDIWSFLPSGKGKRPSFERIGIARGLEGRDIRTLTKNMKQPYPVEWVNRSVFDHKEIVKCQTSKPSPPSPPTSKAKTSKNSQRAPDSPKSVSSKSRPAAESPSAKPSSSRRRSTSSRKSS